MNIVYVIKLIQSVKHYGFDDSVNSSAFPTEPAMFPKHLICQTTDIIYL